MAGAWEQPGGAVGNLRMLDLPIRSTLSPPAEVAVLVSPTGDTQPAPLLLQVALRPLFRSPSSLQHPCYGLKVSSNDKVV